MVYRIGAALAKYYGVQKIGNELNYYDGVLRGYQTVEYGTVNIPLNLYFYERKDGVTYNAFSFNFGGIFFDDSKKNEGKTAMFDSSTAMIK